MDCINFKSTVQIPESIHFHPFVLGDHFRYEEIYITMWGSFYIRSWDHLRAAQYSV